MWSSRWTMTPERTRSLQFHTGLSHQFPLVRHPFITLFVNLFEKKVRTADFQISLQTRIQNQGSKNFQDSYSRVRSRLPSLQRPRRHLFVRISLRQRIRSETRRDPPTTADRLHHLLQHQGRPGSNQARPKFPPYRKGPRALPCSIPPERRQCHPAELWLWRRNPERRRNPDRWYPDRRRYPDRWHPDRRWNPERRRNPGRRRHPDRRRNPGRRRHPNRRNPNWRRRRPVMRSRFVTSTASSGVHLWAPKDFAQTDYICVTCGACEGMSRWRWNLESHFVGLKKKVFFSEGWRGGTSVPNGSLKYKVT